MKDGAFFFQDYEGLRPYTCGSVVFGDYGRAVIRPFVSRPLSWYERFVGGALGLES